MGNKRIGIASLLVLALSIGVLIGTWQATQVAAQSNIIRATGFQLVDGDGNVRGDFVLDAGKPALRLYDRFGFERAQLQLVGDLASLTLNDEGANPRVSISYEPGLAGIDLWDRDGIAAAAMSVRDNGNANLRFYGSDAVTRAELALDRIAGSALTIYDENGAMQQVVR